MNTKQVEIYSTPTCHFCHMAKEWMTSKNIPFTDYNVMENSDKRKEMLEITGQMSVPVIKVGNEIMVGFEEGQLEKLLNS